MVQFVYGIQQLTGNMFLFISMFACKYKHLSRGLSFFHYYNLAIYQLSILHPETQIY
jgi:hypothetical protein